MRSLFILFVISTCSLSAFAQYTEGWTRHYNRNNQVEGAIADHKFVDLNGNLNLITLRNNPADLSDVGYWSPGGMYTSVWQDQYTSDTKHRQASHTTPRIYEVFYRLVLLGGYYDLNMGVYSGGLYDSTSLDANKWFTLEAVDSANTMYIRERNGTPNDHFWIVDSTWTIVGDFAVDTVGYEMTIDHAGTVYLWRKKYMGSVPSSSPLSNGYSEWRSFLNYYDIATQQLLPLDTLNQWVSNVSVNRNKELVVFSTKAITSDYDSVEMNMQVYSTSHNKLFSKFIEYDIYPLEVRHLGNKYWLLGLRYEFYDLYSPTDTLFVFNNDMTSLQVSEQGDLLTTKFFLLPI